MNRNQTLLILCALGLVLSSYLLYQYLQPGPMFCPGGTSSCDIVKNSDFSSLFKIPLPFWGVFYFVFTAIYIIKLELINKGKIKIPLFVPSFVKDQLEVGLIALVLFGLFFETYYTYLQFFIIDAICTWCLMIEITLIGMFVVLLNDYHVQKKSR